MEGFYANSLFADILHLRGTSGREAIQPGKACTSHVEGLVFGMAFYRADSATVTTNRILGILSLREIL